MKRVAVERIALVLLCVAPALFLYRAWFFSLDPLVYGDWLYWAPESLRSLWPPSGGWLAQVRFGNSPVQNLPDLHLYLIYGLFGGRMGIPFGILERALFFFPYLLLVFAGFYMVSREIFNDFIGALLAGFFGMFNSYALLLTAGGHMTVAVAYALLPAFLYALIRGVRGLTLARALGTGVTLALLVMYDLRIAFLGTIMGTAYAVGVWAYRRGRAPLRRVVLLGVTCIIVTGLVHAYWILPNLVYKDSRISLPANYGSPFWLDRLSYFTLDNAMAIFHPWWFYELRGTDIGTTPIPWSFAAFFLLVWTPLLLSPRDRWVVWLSTCSLASIFLLKGAQPPFSSVNTWLFEHVPGFQAFRDPSKFFALALAFEVPLMGRGASLLISRLRPQWHAVAAAAVVIVSCAILSHQFLHSIGGVRVARTPPAQVVALNSFIDADAQYSRILWLPNRDVFSSFSDSHPVVDGDTLQLSTPSAHPSLGPLSWLESSAAKCELGGLAAGYVIVRSESINGAFAQEGISRAELQRVLNSRPWLRLDRKFGDILVYRAQQHIDHISLARDPKSYDVFGRARNDGGKPACGWEKASFVHHSSDRYEVIVTQAPVWMALDQSNDAGWIAEQRGAALNRTAASSPFNVWLVSSPGTVNIYYRPSGLFRFGRSISLATALCLAVYFAGLPLLVARKR